MDRSCKCVITLCIIIIIIIMTMMIIQLKTIACKCNNGYVTCWGCICNDVIRELCNTQAVVAMMFSYMESSTLRVSAGMFLSLISTGIQILFILQLFLCLYIKYYRLIAFLFTMTYA